MGYLTNGYGGPGDIVPGKFAEELPWLFVGHGAIGPLRALFRVPGDRLD